MTDSPVAALGCALYGPRWQAALTRDLGLAQSTIGDWARGANLPRAATRSALIAHAKRAARTAPDRREAIRGALAAFEATEPPRDGRRPKLAGEALDRAAALWRDLSLTSEQVAAETGLHRTGLHRLFGPRRASPRDSRRLPGRGAQL